MFLFPPSWKDGAEKSGWRLSKLSAYIIESTRDGASDFGKVLRENVVNLNPKPTLLIENIPEAPQQPKNPIVDIPYVWLTLIFS